jgi:hypothetical protein
MAEELQFFWTIIDAVETKIILVFCRHGINGSSRVTEAARSLTCLSAI